MGDEQNLTVGEFTRAMSGLNQRLTELHTDVRYTRNALYHHNGRISKIEAKAVRADKRSWGAAIIGLLFALAEGARHYFK